MLNAAALLRGGFGLRPSLRSNFDSQFLHQASRFFFQSLILEAKLWATTATLANPELSRGLV